MTPLTSWVVWILSLGAVFLNMTLVIILIAWWQKDQAWAKKIIELCQRFGLPVVFVLTLTSVMGSLFFSEIAGFEPCKWCWWQRIFMYPQLVIVWLLLVKKSRVFAEDCLIALSVIGAAIASYHYYLQFFAINPLPCSTVGYYQVSCAKRLFVEFGYVTIPMMSLSVFLTIIVLILLNKKPNK